MWLPLPWALFWTLLSSLSLKALSLVPLSVSQLSLSALSKPPLSCLLALSQLSLELSFSFFTKENIALFLTFYKEKHSPILDFLQRKIWPYSWLLTKENREGWGWTTYIPNYIYRLTKNISRALCHLENCPSFHFNLLLIYSLTSKLWLGIVWDFGMGLLINPQSAFNLNPQADDDSVLT